ncbi:MAG: low-specificity L-threonine aldolase [Chloroflexi bacterium]|nr:MAG: low-specificity L-threonine aldolase [Chloroflexota bacterium]MBL1193379.1 low-specificity L-threonine aldolase [Chloroflexota bacterium]NOH10671.1 low-specificity L-threonine aldolase [Chloroflexota bacterium]
MADIIDLRSDTVTKPTPAMREAMAQAKVGDDVYGEDPTVNQLQELAAEMTGMQAAILVPTGTMGNLSSLLAHCDRGDEVILGHLAHTFLYEAGGMAALGGIHPHQLRNQADGTLLLDDIRNAIRPDDVHDPPTKLITLENTHNRCGGVALSVDYTQSVVEIAREHNLKLHIDGARLFNAAVALGVSAGELVAGADSVTFCLSKGLSAPVGSMVCGSNEFIKRVHRMRKMLGGGMRQAGIVAAAGIVALQQMVERMADDHHRANELAEGLGAIEGIHIDSQDTNMVYISLTEEVALSPKDLLARSYEHGVKYSSVGGRSFRMVTHAWIEDDHIAKTVDVVRAAVAG